MDLKQDKLSKSEWESIEIPAIESEKRIFKLIMKCFNNVNYVENDFISIFSYLKLTDTEVIHNYIYLNYLEPEIIKIFGKYNVKYDKVKLSTKALNKSDIIRFENMEKTLVDKKEHILEYILINYMENILKYNDNNDKEHIKYIYTVKRAVKSVGKLINKELLKLLVKMIEYFDDDLDKMQIIKNAKDIIINNNNLVTEFKLYNHQKELFLKVKEDQAKLIFYVAPTGTGKTLSPLGISQYKKVIFVCAVRHVGLALAKAAISCEKCVAFAFGCNDISDIRLHYFSAKEYSKDRKTGGIYKVDNSVGDKVQIMICDIQSYLYAMRYMLAFNEVKDVILYWDEPTITLDYEEHPLHDVIKNNWEKNEIDNIVLSSATLPLEYEVEATILDYRERFGGNTYYIKNYDCSKSIALINRDGYVEAPHYLYRDYSELQLCVKHIESNKTLLRYVDLDECIKLIMYVNKKKLYNSNLCECNNYFSDIVEITIAAIKEYYLFILKHIVENEWYRIFTHFRKSREPKYKSTSYIVSQDAYTLVNGPTLYLTNDIQKIANFCIQSMNFPESIITDIEKIIESNNSINSKIFILEKKYEDGMAQEDMKEKKMTNERGISPELKQVKKNIESLKSLIKTVSLPECYIPNTVDHLFKMNVSKVKNAFTSNISEYIVEQIMLIEDIDNIWKLLLLMGVGVFALQKSKKYVEIMKDLAKSKKLFLIIATSDYIYGTNYQFDHCYLGKDLENMTQEKIIQAMGRVGRNKISDEYTIRLRDNDLIFKIFNKEQEKIEVINMQKLFNSEEELEDLY